MKKLNEDDREENTPINEIEYGEPSKVRLKKERSAYESAEYGIYDE